jgi:competence protein ComEC
VAVSCGLDNDYGHPHSAALESFAAAGAEVYRTDLEGSLTFLWQNNALSVETTADACAPAA